MRDNSPSFAVRLDEKVVPVDRAKTRPSRFKRLAIVVLNHLLWLLFLKSGTLNRRQRPFFGLIYRRLRFQFIFSFVFADFSFCACSVCVNLSLVGEAKITKLFIWKKVGSLPRVTLPSKRVTLHPGSPCPPSQLYNFTCKRFAAIYKETYEKLFRLGWLGIEGNPPSRDNSPPYKQALIIYIRSSVSLLLAFFPGLGNSGSPSVDFFRFFVGFVFPWVSLELRKAINQKKNEKPREVSDCCCRRRFSLCSISFNFFYNRGILNNR